MEYLDTILGYLTPQNIERGLMLVAVVVAMTPTKSDDGLPGRLRNLAEQFGLLKPKDPPA